MKLQVKEIKKLLDEAREQKLREHNRPMELLELNFSFPAKLIEKYGIGMLEELGAGNEDVEITQRVEAGLICNVIRHKKSDSKHRIMYIHGGAFMFGGIQDYKYMCGLLSKYSRCEVLFINYRLAPEYYFPAPVEDCVNVYKRLAAMNDAEKLYICGDSAGATLCFAMMFRLIEEQVRMPDAIASICLSADEERRGKSWKDNQQQDFVLGGFADMLVKDRGRSSVYLNGHSPKDKLASPKYGSVKGFPPVLLQTSNIECLRDDSILMYCKLCADGVDAFLDIHNHVPHVWHLYAPLLEDSLISIQQIGSFFLER